MSGSFASGFSQNFRVNRFPFFQYGIRCAVKNCDVVLLVSAVSASSKKLRRMIVSCLDLVC
jgi:hypothetical protein